MSSMDYSLRLTKGLDWTVRIKPDSAFFQSFGLKLFTDTSLPITSVALRAKSNASVKWLLFVELRENLPTHLSSQNDQSKPS